MPRVWNPFRKEGPALGTSKFSFWKEGKDSPGQKEREERKEREKREKAIKAVLLHKVGKAAQARCNAFLIRAPEITKNMQAKEAHVQKYRQLTIKEMNQ